MLNIKFWQFAFERIEISNFTVAIFAMTLPFFIFIPLFCFFSLIVVPYIGKPLIMLLLVLSAASDYALQNLGIVINSDMIRNFAETNPARSDGFNNVACRFLRLDCRGYSRSFGLSYGDTFPDSGPGNPQPADLFFKRLIVGWCHCFRFI